MRKLLDNPDTMNLKEVIRALNIRELYNNEDMVTMYEMTILLLVVIGSLMWLFILRELLIARARRWVLTLQSSVFAVSLLYLIYKVYSYYFLVGSEENLSGHQWNLQKFFYLCDGVVIMLGATFGISYELMNILAFCVVQPLLIIILGLTVLRYQSKSLSLQR